MENLPDTMRALIQLEDGYSGKSEGPAIADAALYLAEAQVPVPTPAKGQVLIKLRVASVNPSDLHFIKGEYGQPRRKGVPAGFEGCGDVVAAGSGAEGLIGKRVAFAVSLGGSGAWAEYALTDAVACMARLIQRRTSSSEGRGPRRVTSTCTPVTENDCRSNCPNAPKALLKNALRSGK